MSITKLKKKENNKGITLIALVITIIVLLILAGISIATLIGDNGILTKANEAKTGTVTREEKEQIGLAYNAARTEKMSKGNTEAVTADELQTELTRQDAGATAKEKGGEVNKIEVTFTKTNNKYIIDRSNGKIYLERDNQAEEEVAYFNPEELTIGEEAQNADKYGWKVIEYNVKENETGGWRLFYQDMNYTYLISDNCIGKYKPNEYYKKMVNEDGELKYQTGEDVSLVGQKLSPIIKSLFTSDNINANIKATAWLTDTSDLGMWKEYKNSDAVFAIGSPTAELFAASYNATGKSFKIELDLGQYGYMNNMFAEYLSVNANHGIYNKDSKLSWWIASPEGNQNYFAMVVQGEGRFGNDYVNNGYVSNAVRPIVCIPTSIFNSKYTLDSEQ